MKLYKIAETWYTINLAKNPNTSPDILRTILERGNNDEVSWNAAENPNTSPDVLRKILERGKNDIVSRCAATNPNCPPELLKMILEREKDDFVSRYAARNPNCPIDALKMVLERGKDDDVSKFAAKNLSCPPELLKIVLERRKDDSVSYYASRNPNCPLLAKIEWMRVTNQIGNYDPNNPKHFIEYEKPKVDKDLEELREIRDRASKTNNWYKIAKKENWYKAKIAKDPNISPDILRKILLKGGNDSVSYYAVKNPNCPPDALKMVLERGNDDWVSRYAAYNPNCPPDALKMVLERENDNRVEWLAARNPNCPPDALKMVLERERGKNDLVSQNAAKNPNCPPEVLKMILERGKDDWVSQCATENPNCPPLTKILWMRATGKIGNYDPNNPKHFIEYNEPKVDKGLQELREIRDRASKTNNWYKKAQYKDIDDVMYSIYEAQSDIVNEFFSKNRPKNSMMSWSVVPFARLKKIWEDHAKMGFVRDESGINQIANQMLQNLAKLQASTDLAGHSQVSPEEIIKENGHKLTKAKEDDFYWYFLQTPYGTPISDYGLPKLWNIADSLASSTSAEEKLLLIDQMLNVIHQRGDLAALFIEGGSSSLSQLSGTEEKNTEIKAFNKKWQWHKKAQIANVNKTEEQIKKEIQKYKNLKDFQKDYEILYHGGSENIIGDKLSLGARVPGEVTKENLGKGQDYGGIFFTPEKELAKTFSQHSPSGKGAVHKFLVRKNNIFDESNPIHAQQLKNFIGKKYIDVDGNEVEFNYQMYDFMFPKLEDGKRHMDWATFDPHVLSSMGFDGAKVIEHYDAYGTGKHLYSTVLFTGGENSPHWKLKEEDTLENLYQNQSRSQG